MWVACIQTDGQVGGGARSLRSVDAEIREAETDLIVLPELFASGYTFESREQVEALAEPADGPTVLRMAEWAADTGATVVGGFPERDDRGRLFNSAAVVTPRGLLGVYRKTHLFGEETLHFEPGDTGFQVWTVTDRRGRSYRLGVMICFDWYFPESARALALAGADVIAHPSNLVLPHCPDSMPVRALENGVATATANRIGTESNSRISLTFIGRSRICSHRGEVLAEAPRTETATIRAEIDPRASRDKAVGSHNDRFADRRPEFYADPTDAADAGRGRASRAPRGGPAPRPGAGD